MSDREIVTTVRSVVVVGGCLAVGGSLFTLRPGGIEYWWRSFSLLLAIFTVCFAAFVWVVIPLQPRNAAVWTMAAPSLCGLGAVGIAIAPLLFEGDPNELLEA